MSNPEHHDSAGVGDTVDDVDRALISTADVDSAGRSCLFIVALVVVILALLAVWILFTQNRGA